MTRQNDSVIATKALVSAKELQKAVADLQTTTPLPGLIKTAVCALLTLVPLYFSLTSQDDLSFVLWAVVAAVAYGAWLITTHDAMHHTLTGWVWFDELVPRLISWPIIWWHGVYSEVHKLHHKMNGADLADPERVQWTQEEYEQASGWGRLYVRHQWLIDLFVGAGVLLIYKTVKRGWGFASRSGTMRRAIWSDAIGIIVFQAAIYTYAATQGAALKYLGFWLIAERIIGGVLQWRAHAEHYGLWGKGRHYFETQAYNCRNFSTNPVAVWYMNRLNYHSVHHAFPRVPFYHLRAAHQRFQALYARIAPEAPADGPLVQERSYLATTWRYIRHPEVIGPVDPDSPRGRRRMLPLS